MGAANNSRQTGGALGERRVLMLVFSLAFFASGCGGGENPSPGSDGPPVVVAAGDIAECKNDNDAATARLVDGIDGTVLTLGDNAYPLGTPQQFTGCYGPTWGRFKDRTKPAIGNHEYYTKGANGYFGYFGVAAGDPNKGYYSYDLGEWHVVALNSNCEEVGGCGEDAPQVRWLEDDLAENEDRACTLAYFHQPLFTSGEYRPGTPKVGSLWEALYAAGADVVFSGHDHNYQRFAPQDPDGRADPERGIRQFVVGTGGGERNYAIEDPIENTESYNDDTDGILKLTLRATRYDWKFVPVAGGDFSDSGSGRCR